MRKKQKRLILRVTAVLAGLAVAAGFVAFLGSRHFAVLDAKGVIAEQQRDLLLFAAILSLVIILPVFVLTFHIVRTYRVGAKKPGKYTPEWDGSRKLEALWWGIPGLIILVLSVVTWTTSHSLDPYKPIKQLSADQPPLTIQVVALQWKWLFLYPEQKIATVNYLQLPVNRPVSFQITADAPMNSFWIPQLGGQVYAMSGMNSQLHLMATETGQYRGSSANLSGAGFAGMHFVANVTGQNDFNIWSNDQSSSRPGLDFDDYQQYLAKPGSDAPLATYSLRDDLLYTKVIDKYMNHSMHNDHTKQPKPMDHEMDQGQAMPVYGGQHAH